ncbi:AAA family ATPase [Enterococcus faecium]|uniref:McrB family protein n=2 Tax=Enterococcus faecium TaxID=1352 RepID=UPI001FCB147E|nr:AAA family ATPase [Enterococcus faecium]MCZ1582427.1 AAA family ATPase [Enterococcus faecium]MCZ1684224.1 AAA family ATPase [Enterococcus faecium]MCZ1688545.1 AAA family ATPase [Enterococcus faecium]MCZ1697564.1 AAA family ATPase [Enterococcus faecium]
MVLKQGKQDYQIIGYLEDDLNKIKINSDDVMYFFMTPLSDFPSSVIDNVEGIQIYSNTLTKFGFIDDINESHSTRAQSLKEFLDPYIIVCTPKIKRNHEQARNYYQGDDLELIPKPKSEVFKNLIKENESLVPIPVFSINNSDSVIKDETSFENQLLNGKLLGKIINFSKDNEDYPLNVFWENTDGSRVLFGEIIGQNNSMYGVAYRIEKDNFYKKFIDEGSKNYVGYDDFINQTKDIIFVPYLLLQKIIETKKDINEGIENISDSKISPVSSIITEQTQIDISELEDKHAIQQNDHFSEHNEFIERFNQLTIRSKLHYSKRDLWNFHTAMLGDSLVVLAGLSGTGKSQLVTSYAKALQLSDTQIKFISVRPFWEDDSDLLGYADTVNSVYRPGDSGLIDALLEASRHKENIYMVCFDEMNLARVEHYFSQFLSVLEMEPNTRKIKLYNEDLENKLYNSSTYPSTIEVGQNILFVGTINTDESTHQFSDKVLDRSNIISLELVPFHEISEVNDYIQSDQKKRNQLKYDDFKNFKNSNPTNGLTQKEKEMFWKLHLAINSKDKNIGIGWRILKQIDEYLKNLPVQNDLSRKEAIDIQLVQRVLSKIRGSDEQLSELVGKWNENDLKQVGEFEQIINEYPESSDFKYTKKILLQKARELNLHGFTL